ncbi:hypothetical protein O9G_001537 [Rozella allomycis CSF55]|uniref:Uncharacterized protein n=1 Tax=Rozella allomycis (strain CSF55) TaxID=988480 RepID=A0A075B1V2_ROZAC|nr:hypothetical protein O9G_001537 [Rozella allomycis CSF55]|eukprot:EPZ36553.1 hypothetical protein O9G_001537 [Rozella allomycis CSF55]
MKSHGVPVTKSEEFDEILLKLDDFLKAAFRNLKIYKSRYKALLKSANIDDDSHPVIHVADEIEKEKEREINSMEEDLIIPIFRRCIATQSENDETIVQQYQVCNSLISVQSQIRELSEKIIGLEENKEKQLDILNSKLKESDKDRANINVQTDEIECENKIDEMKNELRSLRESNNRINAELEQLVNDQASNVNLINDIAIGLEKFVESDGEFGHLFQVIQLFNICIPIDFDINRKYSKYRQLRDQYSQTDCEAFRSTSTQTIFAEQQCRECKNFEILRKELDSLSLYLHSEKCQREQLVKSNKHQLRKTLLEKEFLESKIKKFELQSLELSNYSQRVLQLEASMKKKKNDLEQKTELIKMQKDKIKHLEDHISSMESEMSDLKKVDLNNK